jgi:HPt (histidine-containing phosphotransfer) domain-containing protein
LVQTEAPVQTKDPDRPLGSSASDRDSVSQGPVEPVGQGGTHYDSLGEGKISPATGLSEADFLAALETDGFDSLVGLRRSNGSIVKYKEILEAFILDVESLSEHLVRPETKEGWTDLIVRVHALKSATANVGALSLSRQASSLEEAAKKGEYEIINQGGLELFNKELAQVKSKIEVALQMSREKSPADSKNPPKAEAILSLKEALEVHNIGLADRLIEEISSNCDQETRAILAAASDQILIADYRAAIKLIEQLQLLGE